jgi:hypothetical protein
MSRKKGLVVFSRARCAKMQSVTAVTAAIKASETGTLGGSARPEPVQESRFLRFGYSDLSFERTVRYDVQSARSRSRNERQIYQTGAAGAEPCQLLATVRREVFPSPPQVLNGCPKRLARPVLSTPKSSDLHLAAATPDRLLL